MKLTDEQLKVIGREAGEAFAKEFWHQINMANPTRMTSMPATYLLKELGNAIGRTMPPNKSLHLTCNRLNFWQRLDLAIQTLFNLSKQTRRK